MNKIFYHQNNYARLSGDELVSMTPGEAEQYCRNNRGVILIAFLAPADVRATNDLFWRHSDMTVKIIRLDETFSSTMTAFLFQDRLFSAGSLALVKNWLRGIDPEMDTYTTLISE